MKDGGIAQRAITASSSATSPLRETGPAKRRAHEYTRHYEAAQRAIADSRV
jgi:hypothetical protein